VVWRTCWGKHCETGEHIGNLKGTYEHIGKLPPPQNIKGKKTRHPECMLLGLRVGCMKFLFPKDLVTIFGLG